MSDFYCCLYRMTVNYKFCFCCPFYDNIRFCPKVREEIQKAFREGVIFDRDREGT